MVERRTLDGKPNPAFRKACGGLLAPDAQRALAALSFTIPVEILADPQIFSVRTIDLPSGLSRHYQRCYLNLDRERFDRYLASLSDGVAEKIYGAVVCKIEQDHGYTLTLTNGRALRCRLLVGADGAASVVAKHLGIHKKLKQYVCLQQLFAATDNQNMYSAVFDQTLTDYSGWTFVKDGITYVGGAFAMHKDPHAKLNAMIEGLEKHGYTFGAPLRREGAMLNRPSAFLRPPVSKDGTAALIGEAAGFVSPSSAEGISFAINSAILAYQSLVKTQDFRRYRAASFSLRCKLFNKNFKLPFMYCPILRKLILKSGITSIVHNYAYK